MVSLTAEHWVSCWAGSLASLRAERKAGVMDVQRAEWWAFLKVDQMVVMWVDTMAYHWAGRWDFQSVELKAADLAEQRVEPSAAMKAEQKEYEWADLKVVSWVEHSAGSKAG